MSLHRFIAVPTTDSPVMDAFNAVLQPAAVEAAVATEEGDAAEPEEPAIEIPFERYFGIGTFPVKSTDTLYVQDIIQACKKLYGIDLTPYYYPQGKTEAGGAPARLFDVTDLTAKEDHERRDQFRQEMHQHKNIQKRSHSPYFYLFIRPIQILIILGLLGYALYRFSEYNYDRYMDETERQDERQEEEE